MKRSVFRTTVKRILGNDKFYDALITEPERAKSAIFKLFMKQNCDSDDAEVIRTFFNELNTKGWFEWEREDDT